MKPLQTPHSAFIHSFISDRLCISVHVKYQFNSICKYDFPSIQEREGGCAEKLQTRHLQFSIVWFDVCILHIYLRCLVVAERKAI